jgi:hypothetical protein
MRRELICLAGTILFAVAFFPVNAQSLPARQYLGFDRNDYPGDAALPALKHNFQFVSYWLNDPPGEHANSWTGKRDLLKKNGFGFVLLFTARLDARLRGGNAAALGTVDGRAAAAAALREGFSRGALIFLDLEEGGRLLPEQATYLFAWIDGVRAGGARAGVYCSGIPVRDVSGVTTTAEDIAGREQARANRSAGAPKLKLWVANDACPPAAGCTLDAPRMENVVGAALRGYESIWQYAQSPRRAQFSASCPKNTAPNGNCYAPGLPPAANVFVDLDVADSPDPSDGR